MVGPAAFMAASFSTGSEEEGTHTKWVRETVGETQC